MLNLPALSRSSSAIASGAGLRALPEAQLQPALEEAEQAKAAGEAGSEAKSRPRARCAAKRRGQSWRTAGSSGRIETVVDVASTVCPCCSGTLNRISEDVAELLDIEPAQLRSPAQYYERLAAQLEAVIGGSLDPFQTGR